MKYFVDGSKTVAIGKPPNKCCQPGVLSNSFLTVATFVTSLKVSTIAYCPLPVPSLMYILCPIVCAAVELYCAFNFIDVVSPEIAGPDTLV